jgi:predicted N-acetyltransferase YhbS
MGERENPEAVERDWEISIYRDEDKPGMLALVRNEYGEIDLADGDYFDWLRAACPPDMKQWLVREKGTGRVISAATKVGMRAIWRGKEIRALLGFNMIVAPEYRRQGIHTELTRQTGEEIQKAGFCLCTIFPNQKSMPQLARSPNHHHVSEVPLLVRPLDMRVLADGHLSNRLWAGASRLGWGLAGRTLWRERRPAPANSSLHVVRDLVLDEAYDRFWQQVRTKYDLMVVRDQAFLTWRFLEIPTRQYEILSARQDGQILGYLVLRLADVRGTPTGIIADFLVLPGRQGDLAGGHLLHVALNRFRESGMPLAGALALPHTQEYGLMRRAGLIRAPKRFAPQPFHLFVRSYCDLPPLKALTNPQTWYISIADHDAV